MPNNDDIRALVAARFDSNACCLECGDSCNRWRLPSGICLACAELEEGGQG